MATGAGKHAAEALSHLALGSGFSPTGRPRVVLIADGVEGTVRTLDAVLRAADLDAVVLNANQLETAGRSDVILLRLPVQDPAASCQLLRRHGHRRIVALSPHGSIAECIRLLDAGADAYIPAAQPKPEVIARIRALLRLPEMDGTPATQGR